MGVIHPLPQLFSNALNEGAKMTTKPDLKKATIRARIRSGWSREKAESTPLIDVHRLKLNDVLKIEADGLSLCSSAYVLGVTTQTLCAFIKRYNLSWRGKRPNFKNFEKNPDSNLQKSIALGLHNMTIHKRMERLQCSYDEAAVIGNRKFTRITKELILKAIELKNSGMTLKDTAKQLNCDAQWLSKKIKEFNK